MMHCQHCDGEGQYETDAWEPHYGHACEVMECEECRGTGERFCFDCGNPADVQFEEHVYCKHCYNLIETEIQAEEGPANDTTHRRAS